jgi:PEP-CTERM motif-containing protein
MRPQRIVVVAFFVTSALTLAARGVAAAPILDTGFLTFTPSGSQFGRLLRDGVPTDWANPPLFPGVTGAPTARAYETFTVNSGPFQYLQILMDDPAALLFASAYLGAFTPINVPPNYGLDLNYLGDAGTSQIFGNPAFFQIVVAPFSDVLIVVNEVNPGAGTGASLNLLVEGFYDTAFNDTAPPIPEPASLALVGSGLALLAVARRRRRSESPE